MPNQFLPHETPRPAPLSETPAAPARLEAATGVEPRAVEPQAPDAVVDADLSAQTQSPEQEAACAETFAEMRRRLKRHNTAFYRDMAVMIAAQLLLALVTTPLITRDMLSPAVGAPLLVLLHGAVVLL